ncbi:MAG: BrnT family toxin [Alphaproteobacteria bacterium]|nr:BrnT family toxin [Alphaproteobacteria bacterium]
MAAFEWDPNKDRENFAKHHVSFAAAASIWDGAVLERTDNRRDYGETRLVAFGETSGVVLSVVYTWRAGARRLISARKADRRERRAYEDELRKRTQPPDRLGAP